MSIQSSINQAVNGMMSMIMPMSLLKEQGKVKQIKAEQEVLKKSNEELKTSNEELKTSNDELTKRKEENEKGLKLWDELWDEMIENAPVTVRREGNAAFISYNPYSAGDQMAGTTATQRVQSAQESRKFQMERLQKAFENIGMGGVNNG